MKLKRIGAMILVAALTLGQSHCMSLPVRAAETEAFVEAVSETDIEPAAVFEDPADREHANEKTADEAPATADDEKTAVDDEPATMDDEPAAVDDEPNGEELADDAELFEDDIETSETDLDLEDTSEEIYSEESYIFEEEFSELFAGSKQYYDLYVGGVQVDSENKDDLVTAINASGGVASGTITYNPETYTLTFENAELIGGYKSADNDNAAIAIESGNKGKLIIKYSGTNTIKCNATYYVCTIRCIDTDLTFEGDANAEMYVYSSSENLNENGALGPNSLTVNGGTVYAIAPFLKNDYVRYGYVPYATFLNGSDENVKLTVKSGKFIAKGWAPLVSITKNRLDENTLLYGSENADGSGLEAFDFSKCYWDDTFINSYRYVEAVPNPEGSYPLYIAGTQVTGENASDLSVIAGVSVKEDGYFKYDAASNTLYMNQASVAGEEEIRTKAWAGINYTGSEKLTIQAEGENSIVDSGTGPISYGINIGSADLDIILTDSDSSLFAVSGKITTDETIAVSVSGKLTVSGSGSFDAYAGAASETDTGSRSVGIKTNDIVVDLEDEGFVTAISDDGKNSIGLWVLNEARLKNGKLSAIADSNLSDSLNIALYLGSREVEAKTVLYVEGGVLDAFAIGSNSPNTSIGILDALNRHKMSITGGKVYAYTPVTNVSDFQAIRIGSVELGQGIIAAGIKKTSEEIVDFDESDMRKYVYFEAYEDPSIWGEIPDEFKTLFDNNAENIPSGVWYAIGDYVSFDGPFTGYAALSDRYYTGEKLTFNDQIFVFHGTRRLWENRDYTVKYANNLNTAEATAAKAPSVIIKGKGSYSSTATFKFAIKPRSIEFADITSLKTVTVNSGSKLNTVVPVISFNGIKLKANKDYTLEYYKVEGASETLVTPSTVAEKNEEYRIRAIAKEGSNFAGEMSPTDYVSVIGIDAKDTSVTAISKVKVTVPKAANLPYIEKGYNTVELFDNREEKTPTIKVSYKNEQLKYGTDFYVDDEPLSYAGKISVTIHGKGKYKGDKAVTIEIGGIPASKVKVACMATSVEYTGRAISDIDEFYKKDSTNFEHVTLYTVEKGQKYPLTEGSDYWPLFTYNGAVGKMIVTFVLSGKYTGTIKKNVTIKARKITGANVTAGTAEYSKAGAEPESVSVTLDGGKTVLREGIDYKLSYKNNKKPAASDQKSPPTVVVKGIGNYTGTASGSFTIEKSDIRKHAGLDIADKVFKDKKDYYKSVPKIMDSGKAVTAGKNKDIEAKPATYKYHYVVDDKLVEIEEGTVVPASTLIVVTAEVHCGANSPYLEGDYTIMGTYRIIASGNNISKAKVALKNPDVQFDNGNAINISPDDLTITLNGKTLTPGTDYGIVGSPKNNRFLGTATVTIRGNGDYGGTRKFTFKIKAKNIKN